MKTDGEGLRERVQELEVANQTLWEREQTLSAALDDLYRVTTGLLAAGSLEELYDEIVVAAVGILHADFATVQSLWPDRGSGGELRLCGHRGLDPVAASRWEWIGLANRTSCAEALRTRHRVAAPDIRKSEILTGDDLEAHLAVGIV